MSDWRNDSRPSTGIDPDADLREADELLLKADALLRKHSRTQSHAEAPKPVGTPLTLADNDEDLPILTEVVDDYPTPSAKPASGVAIQPVPVELAEYLVGLDTELAKEIESWFSTELPQLVAREFDAMSARLRVEAIAHMRATLVPALSDRIAARLDSIDRKPGAEHK